MRSASVAVSALWIAERYTSIAEDQGSADPGIALNNYLSEAERRKHRREAMYDELTGLLDGFGADRVRSFG